MAPIQVKGARAVTTPGGASAVEAVLDSAVSRPAPTLEQVLRGMPLVMVRDGAGAATELEYEPAAYGTLWGEAPLAAGLRLGVAATGTGRQRYIDLDAGAFATLAPSVHLDVRLLRAFAVGGPGPWRRVDATLACDNLADQVVFDQAGLPLPGRTVRLQIRLQ